MQVHGNFIAVMLSGEVTWIQMNCSPIALLHFLYSTPNQAQISHFKWNQECNKSFSFSLKSTEQVQTRIKPKVSKSYQNRKNILNQPIMVKFSYIFGLGPNQRTIRMFWNIVMAHRDCVKSLWPSTFTRLSPLPRAQGTHVKLFCSSSKYPLRPQRKQFLLCDSLSVQMHQRRFCKCHTSLPREKQPCLFTSDDSLEGRLRMLISYTVKSRARWAEKPKQIPYFPMDAKPSSGSWNR